MKNVPLRRPKSKSPRKNPADANADICIEPAAPSPIDLTLQNQHRHHPVNLRLLRQMTLWLLKERLELTDCEISICLVDASAMTALNQSSLGHEGSTDVITFDYNGNSETPEARAHPGRSKSLSGEIIICLDDAAAQARSYQTTWASELARYVIHGVLHLMGYDDLSAKPREKMKHEENQLLREMAKLFPVPKLAPAPLPEKR